MRHPLAAFLSDPPTPANDVPLIVAVGTNELLRVQRAVFSAIGVRFLGFRHGDTALLALLTSPAAAVLVERPVDRPADRLIAELVVQGETAPIIRLGDADGVGGVAPPQSPAAARALLVRAGVLGHRLRPLG